MKVLIIPEDPTHDRHILQPIVQAMFGSIGKKARVEVLTNPHLTGHTEALDKATVAGIVEDNAMVDVFLLLVDRDCDRKGAEVRAASIEAEHTGRLWACLAHQEVEVWALALHRDDLADDWGTVRGECDPKERYYDALVATLGIRATVGQGRKRLMRALPGNWRSLRGRCPELADLEKRLTEALEAA